MTLSASGSRYPRQLYSATLIVHGNSSTLVLRCPCLVIVLVVPRAACVAKPLRRQPLPMQAFVKNALTIGSASDAVRMLSPTRPLSGTVPLVSPAVLPGVAARVAGSMVEPMMPSALGRSGMRPNLAVTVVLAPVTGHALSARLSCQVVHLAICTELAEAAVRRHLLHLVLASAALIILGSCAPLLS